MKKLLLQILIALIATINAGAQEIDIESLQHIVNNSTDTLQRIEANNELAWRFRHDSVYKALKYANSAIQLAKKAENLEAECTGYARAGEIQMFLGELSKAQDDYERSLSIAQSINNHVYIGRAANSLSIIHRRLGNNSLAIEYGRKATSMFNIKTHQINLSMSMDNLGLAFISKSIYDSAFFFLNKSLESRALDNNPVQMRHSYANLAYLYYILEDYSRALIYNQKALETFTSDNSLLLAKVYENVANIHYHQGNFNTAETYHLKSLHIRESKKDSISIANSLHNLGLIFETRGEYSKATEYIKKGLTIYEKRNYQRSTLIGYVSLGNLYFDIEDNDNALTYLLKGYELGQQLNLLINFPSIILKLAILYDQLGNTEKALAYSFEFGELESESRKAINRANRLELSTVEGNSTEALLFQKHLNSDLTAKNSMLTITLLTVGIILSTLLFFVLMSYQKLRQKKVLAEKNGQIRQQENEELLKRQELAALGAMLEGQEKERKRIARDLHDRIGSMLSMVKIHFKSVEDNLEILKIQNRDQYQRANELLDEACDEVRKVAHDMVSGVLMKFGLISALKNLCNSVQSTGQLRMELIDFGLDERLDYDYEINIYRIVQELLSNVLKHAEATEMSIQLLKKGGSHPYDR